MIVVKTSFNSIVLSDSTDFALWADEYPVDKAGNKIPLRKATEDSPKLGDLIIQTPTARYIYTKVPCVYKWVAQINDCIAYNLEEGKNNFVIDLGIEIIQTDDLAIHEFCWEEFLIEKA